MKPASSLEALICQIHAQTRGGGHVFRRGGPVGKAWIDEIRHSTVQAMGRDPLAARAAFSSDWYQYFKERGVCLRGV